MRRSTGLCCLLTATVLSAQQPPHTVRGRCVDEAGAPLAGVAVRLETPRLSCEPWAPSALRSAALPAARSGVDGGFALAVPAPLLAIGSSVHARFTLVAELPGRQSWRQDVPPPLSLWHGGRLVLPPLRDADRATIEVADARPGMLVRLERSAHGAVSPGDLPLDEQHLLAVPTDGRLQVHVPLLPNPPAVQPGSDLGRHGCGSLTALGWRVQLLFPGRCSEPVGIGPGDTLRFAPPPAPPAARKVRRGDGQPVRGIRVLLRVTEGECRWFAVAGDGVPREPPAPVLAIAADGCAAIAPDAALVLPPVVGRRRLQVVGDDGLPPPRLEARWLPLQQLPPLPTPRPLGRLLPSTAEGVELPTAQEDPGLLQLRAPGHAAVELFDPRHEAAPARLHLQPQAEATLRVQIADEAGAPVPSALVEVICFGAGSSARWLPFGNELALTRDDGTARCECVPASGSVQVEASAPGFRIHAEPAQWRELREIDGERWISLRAERLLTFRLRTVDAAGKVVPFTTIAGRFGRERAGQLDVRFLLSDADGEAWLQATATEAADGFYDDSGRHLLKVDAVSDLVVRPRQLVLVRIPEVGKVLEYGPTQARGLLDWLPEWRSAPGVLAGTSMVSAPAQGLLLAWPENLQRWWHDVPGAPPVVVAREEVEGRGAVAEIDRRPIAHRVPLRLGGDVPPDLGRLRAPPRFPERQRPNQFASDHLEAGDGGTLWLLQRGSAAQAAWLCHPDRLPVPLQLPKATGGEVTAELQAGAPVTLQLRLGQPLGADERPVFAAATAGWFSREDALCPVDDPALRAASAGQLVTLRAPFALPPGRFDVELRTYRRRAAARAVAVRDQPLSVELGGF